MTTPIKLLDVVALTVDLPEDNLWRGQVGTIVEILAGENAYEVEFSDRQGGRMNPWGYVLINCWCCTTIRYLPCHPQHQKQRPNKRDTKGGPATQSRHRSAALWREGMIPKGRGWAARGACMVWTPPEEVSVKRRRH
jgi:hypothetical protein